MPITVRWQSDDGMFGGRIKVADARQRYQSALTFLQNSETARRIIAFVNSTPDDISLVCAPDAEGQFVVPGEIAGSMLRNPTIVWDPNKNFFFYSSLQNTGNTFFANECSYPPAIVVLHEMGHCKQWLEDKAKYMALLRQNGGVDTIEADNLLRHEAPVARELGFKVRDHYKHFPGSDQTNALRLGQAALRKTGQKLW